MVQLSVIISLKDAIKCIIIISVMNATVRLYKSRNRQEYNG